jgi:hypothetical protein
VTAELATVGSRSPNCPVMLTRSCAALAPTEWGRFTIFPPSDETVKQIARPVARALIQTDCAIVEPEMQEEEKWPRKARVEYYQSRTGWRWRVLSAGNRKDARGGRAAA